MVWYTGLRENSANDLEKDKGVHTNMRGCIIEVNTKGLEQDVPLAFRWSWPEGWDIRKRGGNRKRKQWFGNGGLRHLCLETHRDRVLKAALAEANDLPGGIWEVEWDYCLWWNCARTFRSKFNHGCLHWATLKALYGFE